MSNKKRRYKIEPVSLDNQEQKQLRGVLSRIKGKSPIESTGPIDSLGPIESGSPVDSIGPIQNEVLGQYETGPIESTGLPDFSLLTSLPEAQGFVLWFHQYTDHLCRHLTAAEQVIYLQLYRLTWGFNRSRCQIGMPKLAERAGISESPARIATKGLEKKGLIRKIRHIFGKGVEQGIEWEVFEPPALKEYRAVKSIGPVKSTGPTKSIGPVDSTPMKDLKTHKENSQTQPSVSVGSRFSLEECKKFADHLKKSGQGINNPGGYATTIFRTGEADEMIEAFLNPPAKITPKDCPDCNGQGWVYPNGIGGAGVKKCEHPKLKNAG